ncbi:MAG TPA: helix-turn-helix domain-containing protein [Allosphingosinicella sp.]|jgi:cytoskeletal protein RodZ|nr:helix-turn-helix domain-containing protein [Allosphingosinicella sp.]
MIEMDQDQTSGAAIGERLRQAREAKGLSLDDIARQTRIPIRHLEHIEREEWDALPAITYSVGFVRSYANAVGLDGPAMGAELREQLGGIRSAGAISTAYYEPADPARVPPRWIALAAALLAILLVVGYLVWRHHAVGDADAVGPPAAEVPPPANAPAPKPQPSAQLTPASASGPVTLTASEDVWVRVYEAGSDKSLFQGMMKAGQTWQVPATAQAPEIRTGRPNVLKVAVGNTAIPPLGPPEKMVKNVSLKPADLIARANGAPPPSVAAPAPAPRRAPVRHRPPPEPVPVTPPAAAPPAATTPPPATTGVPPAQ